MRNGERIQRSGQRDMIIALTLTVSHGRADDRSPLERYRTRRKRPGPSTTFSLTIIMPYHRSDIDTAMYTACSQTCHASIGPFVRLLSPHSPLSPSPQAESSTGWLSGSSRAACVYQLCSHRAKYACGPLNLGGR